MFSRPQTSSGMYIAFSITCRKTILKAICAGVGFGSGTETSLSVARYRSARKQEGYIWIPVQGLSCFSSPQGSADAGLSDDQVVSRELQQEEERKGTSN